MPILWDKDQTELAAAKKEVMIAEIAMGRSKQVYADKLYKLTTIELRIRDRQRYDVYEKEDKDVD